MKKVLRNSAGMACALLLALGPATVFAEEQVQNLESSVTLSSIIITEIQPGLSGAAGSEFIELYNTTDEPIALAGWQLWYVPATQTAALDRPSKVVALGGEESLLLPRSHYVLATENYLPTIAQQAYDFTVAASGTWRLLRPLDSPACTLQEEDIVGWGAARFFEQQAISLPGSKQAVARAVEAGTYVDRDNNALDFIALVAAATTPGQHNIVTASSETPVQIGDIPMPKVVVDPHCEPELPEESEDPDEPSVNPPPTTQPPASIEQEPSEPSGSTKPVRNVGLSALHITELLPNPAKPYTDANDEFIELYNSNDASFDLSDYTLQVGLTSKRRYTFPGGTTIKPHSFQAFFSADTKLALSNSSSQVQLLDPRGNVIATTEVYQTAKDGAAWALAQGKWHWTTTPTPHAANVIKASTTKTKTASVQNKGTGSTNTKGSTAASADDETAAVRDVASATVRTPLHPGVLVLVGVFAVLYGAYEYRSDVANKFYQYRRYRETRRSLRQGPKGQ